MCRRGESDDLLYTITKKVLILVVGCLGKALTIGGHSYALYPQPVKAVLFELLPREIQNTDTISLYHYER